MVSRATACAVALTFVACVPDAMLVPDVPPCTTQRCGGGACIDGRCAPVPLAQFAATDSDLQIAAAPTQVFACSSRTDAPLWTIDAGDSVPVPLVEPLGGCRHLIVESDAGHVIYSGPQPGGNSDRIIRLRLDGSGVVLEQASEVDGLVATSASLFWGGTKDELVYRVATTPSFGVFQTALDHSATKFMSETRSALPLGAMSAGSDDRIYFSIPSLWEIGVAGVGADGFRFLFQGRAPEHTAAGPRAIAVRGDEVFFGFGRTVWRVPVDGRSPATPVSTNEIFPTFVVADDQGLAWIDAGASALRTCPIEGGPVTTLATGLEGAEQLEQSDDFLYWVEQVEHRVMRQRKPWR